MKEYPLVSVIVPVYNVEAYIEECLDSIIDQTYEKLEIIVIDDGSTDNSQQKIQPYLTDNRVQLIEQENRGLSGARNTGLKAATGEYILFVDSDDYIEVFTIKEVVEKLEKNQVDLIRFNGKAFLDELNDPIKQNSYDFSHRLQEEKIYTSNLYEANRRTFVSPVYLYIIRREVLEKNHIYFYEGILHEDELFTAQLFLAVESMMYMNRFYYNRRYRENSIMTTQSPERLKRTFDSYLIIYKELERLYFNDIYSNEQRKMIKRQMLSIYSGMGNSQIEKKLKEPSMKKLKGITKIDKLYLQLQKMIHSIKK
ncbi:glycosyltransferase [Desemzia sp. RIT804]|uniref:glycosyltransferase family 2 protein n=1 Tax=Desemzia sp. RIT 804 TaxID=2810209 RepID=UPI00194F259B|nr:glycosyltransferase [Desemzia sp. RIT 804]MBM6614271.1 glycosyltransferase [Desemzia sp. RIT 804]